MSTCLVYRSIIDIINISTRISIIDVLSFILPTGVISVSSALKQIKATIIWIIYMYIDYHCTFANCIDSLCMVIALLLTVEPSSCLISKQVNELYTNRTIQSTANCYRYKCSTLHYITPTADRYPTSHYSHKFHKPVYSMFTLA